MDEMTCARSLFHAFSADNDGLHVMAVDSIYDWTMADNGRL